MSSNRTFYRRSFVMLRWMIEVPTGLLFYYRKCDMPPTDLLLVRTRHNTTGALVVEMLGDTIPIDFRWRSILSGLQRKTN